MAKNKKVIYSLLAIPLVILLGFLSTQPCDMDIYMDGARKFQAGSNPYAGPFIRYLQYYYSPFFAMLLSFFLWVPVEIIKFVWMAMMLLALWRTTILARPYFPLAGQDKRTRLWLLPLAAISAYFAWLNLIATQMTIFIVWSVFESMRLTEEEKPVTAGVIIGILLNIKLLLLPFLAYFIYRKDYKTAAYAVFTFILLLILPAMYAGWTRNIEVHRMWWASVNPQNAEHTLEGGSGWHSLSAMLPKYISVEYLPTALLIARLFFMSLTLFFLGNRPFTPAPGKLHQFREISYLCMVIVLIFPHQRFYSFYLLVPAFAYCTYFFCFTGRHYRSGLYYFSIALFTICIMVLYLGNDVVPHEFYSWLYRHAAMTWSVIGVIAVLGMLRPKNFKSEIVTA
jgi:hypothetical protein